MIRCGKRGTNHCKPWQDYRPSNAERTAKKQRAFDAIGARIEEEGLTDELRTELDAVRPQKCKSCRIVQAKSDVKEDTQKGSCRAFWYQLRKAPCVDCGRADGFSEYDHQDKKKKCLGNYAWWVTHGGVEAMKQEAATCVPRCRNCHQQRENTAVYQTKYATWEEMPETTVAERTAKWEKKQIHLKDAYINAIKLERGACADCQLPVEGNPVHIFVFAHIDAKVFEYHMADLRRSRQSFETAKPLIDVEAERCRVLCANCHSKESRKRGGDMTIEEIFDVRTDFAAFVPLSRKLSESFGELKWG